MKKTFGLGPSGTLMGEGTPKICIPIVAETVEEIRKKAEEISRPSGRSGRMACGFL